jgi:hypothetical protein
MASKAAERMRATRQRRREGYRCVSLEIHQSQIAILIDRGFLDPDHRADPSSIASALAKHLELTFDTGGSS